MCVASSGALRLYFVSVLSSTFLVYRCVRCCLAFVAASILCICVFCVYIYKSGHDANSVYIVASQRGVHEHKRTLRTYDACGRATPGSDYIVAAGHADVVFVSTRSHFGSSCEWD